ncbi:MAG: SurA N-terminal domain-containing protein [Deltaproteobacteria bacterium]|jgi:peptidyl-prolyl cis-trans isomerase SurA|nr:SurA N-terminal domain-containing protein [Deltaproteobacteria bacterium]
MTAPTAAASGHRAAAILLAALLVAAAWPSAASAATTVDRIVAQVNRNVITLSELQARMNTLSPPQKAALSGAGDLQRQVLDMMIDEELVNQAAQKIGIQVPEAEVDEAVKSVMDQNKMNADTFRRALASVGTSLPAFRNQVRLEILKNKVVSYSIMSRVVVTEEEVTRYLNGEVPAGAQSAFSTTGVSDFNGVRIIFLPSSPSQAGRVMAAAARIKAEIDAGLPFAEAAKKYSKGPGAEQGGDPGNLVVRDLQPELQALARKLEPGKVSEPLNGGDAVLLITVVEGTPAPAPKSSGRKGRGEEGQSFTVEQRQGARRTLEEMKMRNRYETWIADLRSAAIIRVTL